MEKGRLARAFSYAGKVASESFGTYVAGGAALIATGAMLAAGVDYTGWHFAATVAGALAVKAPVSVVAYEWKELGRRLMWLT